MYRCVLSGIDNSRRIKKSVFIIFIITFSFFASCKKTEVTNDFIRPVKVDTVSLNNEIVNTYSGIVDAAKFANLAFRVSGQIIQLDVVEGQVVKKDEVIAVVDPREILLRLDAAKANYETSLAKLQRSKILLTKNAVSVQEVEVAQANFEQARSNYEAQKNNYNYTFLKAPFAGSIAKLKVENFQNINSGEIIGQLIDSRDIKIYFTLPDMSLSLIQDKNKSFTVEFEVFRGIQFKAELKGYVEASPGGSGIPVFLTITDPRFNVDKYEIKPGFACNVTMTVKLENKGAEYPVVPLTAILGSDDDNVKYVWIYNPQTSTVKKQAVTTGSLIGLGDILVTSGLEKGNIVVTAGVTQIIDGEKVKILQGP